jgi:hypothetical protein
MRTKFVLNRCEKLSKSKKIKEVWSNTDESNDKSKLRKNRSNLSKQEFETIEILHKYIFKFKFTLFWLFLIALAFLSSIQTRKKEVIK